ncbi:MAG: dolichyl-phosphate beta-glucosyltransferase, partial [Terriglobales bacterium]
MVPAYNESARIGSTLNKIVEHLRQQRWDAEVIVVDDGSRDDTLQVVNRFAVENPEVRVVQNPGNQGKGYAVRNGMMNARGQVLLFTDADLSSPITEAAKLFAALAAGADVAIGSRWLDPSLQFQRQSLKRQALSRLYNFFLRVVLWFPYRDTQCGFKAFTRRAADMIFPLQRVTRWGFDPEILYLAHRLKLKVAEVPVAWGHDERSKIHPLRDGMRMGLDAMRVRWYAMSGKYSIETEQSSARAPRGLTAVGVFLFFGAAMAALAGTTLAWPGTPLDKMWKLNPEAYRQLAPLGRWIGVGFLLLSAALAMAGVGWFRRRLWGYWLAVIIIITQVLGDLFN